MLNILLLQWFEKQNLTDSAKNNKIFLMDKKFLLLLLYEKEDTVTRTIIDKYGAEINELLGFVSLYTHYDKNTLKKWGNEVKGQIILDSQDFSNNLNEDELFVGIKKLGDSFGIKKYPAIIIVNPFNTKDCITQEIEMPNGKNYEEIAARLYDGYFKKLLKLLNDNEINKKSYAELSEIIKTRFNNIARHINEKEELRTKLIDAFNPLRVYYNSMKKKYGKNTIVEQAALGMSTSAFNKRFNDTEIQFTRDEIICLSINIGLDIDETNDFILLNNKDDKILDKNSSKDCIFINCIENTKNGINYTEIVDNLKNNNAGKLQFKEGSINAIVVVNVEVKKDGNIVKIKKEYEYCTEKRARTACQKKLKDKGYKYIKVRSIEIK